MRKKVLSVLLIVTFFCTIIIPFSLMPIECDSNNITSVVLDAEIKNQNIACLSNEELYASFGFDETYIYPDDFSGSYIENGRLIVLITSPKSKDKYYKLFSNKEYIDFKVADYSYNELYSLAEKTVNKYCKDIDSLSYYVDVRKNRAVISLSSKYKDNINTNIINDDRLVIRYEERRIIP